MTKITLENEDGVYSIEVTKECVTMTDIVEDLLIPLLSAAGFHQDMVRRTLTGEQE